MSIYDLQYRRREAQKHSNLRQAVGLQIFRDHDRSCKCGKMDYASKDAKDDGSRGLGRSAAITYRMSGQNLDAYRHI